MLNICGWKSETWLFGGELSNSSRLDAGCRAIEEKEEKKQEEEVTGQLKIRPLFLPFRVKRLLRIGQ